MNSVTLSDLVSNFIIHEWFIIWSNCNSLDPSNKVEILNAHFSNIANIDNEPVISDNVTPLPCHLNEFIITEQEILDQLKI
jgi:hypothetical protein